MTAARWAGGFVLAIAVFAALAPFMVAAQSDGSMPPADQQSAGGAGVAEVPVESVVPAQSTTTPVAESAPTAERGATSSPAAQGASATPRPTSGVPAPAQGVSPEVRDVTIVAAPPMVEAVPEPESSGSSWLWPVLTILALVPFGFLAAKLVKKKPEQSKESDKRCFDIKRLLEEKLEELTDLRAMAEGKVKKVAKEQLREAVQGTVTGDALVRLEKLEAEYNRLKKLYEECTIDADRYKYKGVLVKNSLRDTSILDNLKIVQTRGGGDRTLHDIRLSSGQIDDIRKHMDDGPWYFHVWQPGTNDVTVAYKNKIFAITSSDKATWADAIAYGRSLGIPEEKLDFRME